MMTLNKIQELEDKKNIGALLEGDKFPVKLTKYEGMITFLTEDEGTLYFIRKQNGEILEYSVEEIWTDVKNKRLIQTRHFDGIGEPTQHKKGSDQYEIYSKIISQN